MPSTKRERKSHVVDISKIGRQNLSKERGEHVPSSILDLKAVKPYTYPQKQMFSSFSDGLSILGVGCAGTGKTFCALYMALAELFSKKTATDRIIIIRSAVATRDIGFLPGTEEEKLAVFEVPYQDIVCEITGKPTAYEKLKTKGSVKFMSTSHIRGLTWDNSIVIADEIQNFTFHEINSVMTRLGENSRIIAVGDFIQSDLVKNRKDVTGIQKFVEVARIMDDFDVIEFQIADIVRSGIVKRWISAVEEVG